MARLKLLLPLATSLLTPDLTLHLNSHYRVFSIFSVGSAVFFLSPECTFIVLDAEKWSRQKATEEDCMVGDVNLFLTDPENPALGEVEVMIAGTFNAFNNQ